MKTKRSQVTIFVILALVIIGLIVLFFAIRNPNNEPSINPGENPQGYMEKCAKDALVSAEKLIISHSGFANASDFMFNNTGIAYLCYSSKTFELCTNKHPALSNVMEKEIALQIEPKIKKCFNDVKEKFKNYNYQEENLNLSVEISPKKLTAKINKKITYTAQDKTTTLNNFDVYINSPLYDFSFLTNKIINQELACDCGKESCNADMVGLSIENRNYEISKPIYNGNGVEVYNIEETLSGKEFNFAIRNCVFEVKK